MFRKKKKRNIYLEDEVIAVTSKDEIIIEEKVDVEEIEVIQVINLFKEKDLESEELVLGDFTFYDSDPNNECKVDEDETDFEKDKKELSSYFKDSKKQNKKLRTTPIKEKRKSKRIKKRETDKYNVKSQKVYVFRKKKYSKIEDFITFLNGHYLEIDKISQEVLDDEKFYGWLSKKSGVFDDSIKQFKEIKDKIEKK